MKQVAYLIVIMGLLGCSHQKEQVEALQHQVDSLESKLAETYKPGFGEFMSNIQAHHAKLWFAGQNQNWELAEFEVDEITEGVEDVQKYQSERNESQSIPMIDPALEKVKDAIQKQDPVLFDSSYILLTNTCNACHHATEFTFNVVKIPDMQTFRNQDFRILP